MNSKPLDEFGLIARYLAPLADHPGANRLRDDVAVLLGRELASGLILNTDALVEGVHFPADEAPGAIAERALRVNLSDLAAKGARPLGYLLAMALPPATDEAWVAAFAEGLKANQAEFSWSLLGGDTVRTPGPLTLSVTALGSAPAGEIPRRERACAGDTVWVTGWIGDGALGLAVAQGRAPDIPPELAAAAEAKFRRPEPRVGFCTAAVERGLIRAAADVSDGLVADLAHIVTAGGIGAALSAAEVPLSPAGQAAVAFDREWLATMISGGDDYEVVFTADPAFAAALSDLANLHKIRLTPIGMVEAEPGVRVFAEDGAPLSLPSLGFRHF